MVFVILSEITNGQEFKSLQNVLVQQAKNNSLSTLIRGLTGPETIDAKKVGELLRLQLETDILPDSLMSDYEKDEMQKIIPSLDSIFKRVENIAGQSPYFNVVMNGKTKFIYPFINLAKYKEENILVINGLYYDYAFNNIKTSESQRLKEVLSKLNIPFIYNIKEIIKVPRISKICIVSGYVNKDFSNKFDRGKSETIGLLIDKKIIQQLFDLEITDTELLNNSELFYTNQDIGFNFKKIDSKSL